MATFKKTTASTFIQTEIPKHFTLKKTRDIFEDSVHTSKYSSQKLTNYQLPILQSFNKTILILLFLLSPITVTYTYKPTPLYDEKDAVICIDKENFKEVCDIFYCV